MSVGGNVGGGDMAYLFKITIRSEPKKLTTYRLINNVPYEDAQLDHHTSRKGFWGPKSKLMMLNYFRLLI